MKTRKPNTLGNGTSEVVFRRQFGAKGDTYVTIHDRVCPDAKARFAMGLISRHAGITAQSDGEDSSGRARARKETPVEAVTYACQLADAAFAEFKDRGWLIDVPAWEETVDRAREEN